LLCFLRIIEWEIKRVMNEKTDWANHRKMLNGLSL
jgi:hypothetical protein